MKRPFSESQTVNTSIPPPTSNGMLNVILASQDTLWKRRQEFSKAKIKINVKHLNQSQQSQLLELLSSNYAAFSSSLDTLGHTDRVEPVLKFNSDYPIKALPFPIPQSLQQEAKNQIDQMVQAGIIEKNIASWACPMLLVKKKPDAAGNQTYRLALDLRLLNTVIEHSSYPLPRIQSLIGNISKYKYFTLLDMPSAYYQVKLPEEYQDRISFTSPWGTFKYKRLPFGMKNSASYFQALADSIIEEINMPGIEAYQDDFIIGSNSFEETVEKVTKFLNVFQKANLTLNLNKCIFHTNEINFLGFHLKENKVYPITSNIQKIHSFPTPTTKKHVKKFLGLCGFYRNLIPLFAQITDPLVQVTSPKVQFKWSETTDTSFKKLQKIFFNKPFIQQPVYDAPFFLNTDASAFAISAVLLQEHNGQLLPVSYFSRSIKKSEKNYPAIKLELMAIVFGVRAFKNILYGRHFILLSDSKPLQHYKKTVSPADIITRWLLELSEYTFTFKHIPGKDNILADYLSRTPVNNNMEDLASNPNLLNTDEILPVISEAQVNAHSIVNNNSSSQDPMLEISDSTFLNEQHNDKEISKIRKEVIKCNKRYRNFTICPTTYLVLQIKQCNNFNTNIPIYRIVVPDSLKDKCLRIHHLSHYGIDKTFKSLSERYYWRGMFHDVTRYVNSCTRCLTSKPQNIPTAPFQHSHIPSRPGEVLSIDFVGPFSNGSYIMTAIDHFSRHLQLYPMRKITAMNAVQAIFDYIVIYGRPQMILADNGKQYVADMFEEFNRMLGVKLRHTTVKHPQANAISERINAAIKSTIKALMQDGYSFEHAVSIHQMSYNNTFHTTTKTSPNKVHFGRSLSGLIDTFSPIDINSRLDVHSDYFDICTNLQKLYDQIHGNLLNYQKLQDQRQKRPKLQKINIGDIVYMDDSSKFKHIYKGPYIVKKRVTNVIFKVQLLEEPQSKPIKVHINRLKLAPPRKPLYSEVTQNETSAVNLLPPVNNSSITSTVASQDCPHDICLSPSPNGTVSLANSNASDDTQVDQSYPIQNLSDISVSSVSLFSNASSSTNQSICSATSSTPKSTPIRRFSYRLRTRTT